MKKFFSAILMLACAFMFVVMTGCEKEKNHIDVRVYDATNDENVESSVLIDENITLEKVVDEYINSYISCASNGNEEVKMSLKDDMPKIAVKEDGDIAICSFSKILENMGVQSEAEFIENLCYTIVKNFPNFKGIYIDVNGEEYVSGHYYFELDELICAN